ncbi:transposase [Nocardioides sp.]|uniref:transposase n=1 Tax=Nocardioides sp. TaxID=35761 RepID=UPI003528DDEC
MRLRSCRCRGRRSRRCVGLGISEQTFYRWRIKYGALKEDEAQRLKALEASENARLKRDCCRAGVGHLDAQGPAEGKLVSQWSRRAAVTR